MPISQLIYWNTSNAATLRPFDLVTVCAGAPPAPEKRASSLHLPSRQAEDGSVHLVGIPHAHLPSMAQYFWRAVSAERRPSLSISDARHTWTYPGATGRRCPRI